MQASHLAAIHRHPSRRLQIRLPPPLLTVEQVTLRFHNALKFIAWVAFYAGCIRLPKMHPASHLIVYAYMRVRECVTPEVISVTDVHNKSLATPQHHSGVSRLTAFWAVLSRVDRQPSYSF